MVDDIVAENRANLVVQDLEVNRKVMEWRKKQEDEDREIEREFATLNLN